MKSIHLPIRLFLLALLVLAQAPAFAWGPESREAITRSAYRILQYDIYEIAKAGDISYEADLIRGARDGKSIIAKNLPLNTDQQAMEAIASEIQLLRAVRKNGVGSHFAYRLGVLSALIADTMQPYGNAYTDEQKELKKSLDASMDELVYRMNPTILKTKNKYVLSIDQYFYANRPMFKEDLSLIREDYRHDEGFDGFASNAMEGYFIRSVEMIVDVWYTIMNGKENPRASKPSKDSITRYYVDEIGYLLSVRENLDFAKRAYGVYQKLDTRLIETHIDLGDQFYAFGTEESMEIGVNEWKVAQKKPGKVSKDASRRLSAHYISLGDSYVENAQSPEYLESDYTDAIRAYHNAFTYDRTNEIASSKVIEATDLKEKRDKARDKEQTYIDEGLEKVKEAEKARNNENFGQSLISYNSAIILFEQVTDLFRDLKATASDNINNVNNNKKSTIREVINTANNKMEQADDALLNAEYDLAIEYYNAVSSTVSVILTVVPEGSVDEKTVNALIETAEFGKEDVGRAKKRAEEKKNAPPVPGAKPGANAAKPPAAKPAPANNSRRNRD